MDKHNILFVDDEKNILHALRRLFRKEDYCLHFASSAKEALGMIDDTDFSLIVTDYRMPEMNGVDFLKAALPRAPESMRIILSGYSDIGAILDAVNDCAIYKYIIKPCDDEDLRLTVRRAVEQFASNMENARLAKEINEKNIQLEGLNKQLARNFDACKTNLMFSHEVLYHLPVAVIGIDYEKNIVFANAKAESIFADRGSTVIDTSVDTVFDSSEAGNIAALLEDREKDIDETLYVIVDHTVYAAACSRLRHDICDRGILMSLIPLLG